MLFPKLICAWKGHKWRPVWTPGRWDSSLACNVCIRCRENGWALRR